MIKVKCIKSIKNGLNLDEKIFTKNNIYEAVWKDNKHLVSKCDKGFNVTIFSDMGDSEINNNYSEHFIGIVGGLLSQYEVCEFADKCNQECFGKDSNRKTKFSCALRRGFLIENGYEVMYGYTIDEIS